MSNSLAIGTGTGFRRAFGRRERAASVAAASTLDASVMPRITDVAAHERQ